MSYWFEREKKRVGKERDKRRKLTEEDRAIIRRLYNLGMSIRGISKLFSHKTTRRNIQFILFPEDKERHKIYVRRYRKHLKEIYGLKGKQRGCNNEIKSIKDSTI
jgi:DNA-binding transcriptional MerR regulator